MRKENRLVMRAKLAVMGLRGFPNVQGGVERHCESIYPRLGIAVRVYRRKRYVNVGIKSMGAGVEFVDLPSPGGIGWETGVHSLLCVLHLLCHPVQVVSVHNIGPGLLIPLLRLRGMRCVLTYHSANYLHEKWSRPAKTLLRIAEKIALRSADKIIFVSRTVMEGMSDRVKRKSVVIPNAVRLPLNRGCGAVGKTLLAVGRLTPEKGYDTLVIAAQLLPKGWRVVIAGGEDNGSVYGDYLRRLDTGGRVEFMGYCDRVTLDSLYSQAGVFVLPSLHEGLSLALLEAMSWGLPVVVSDIAANHLEQLGGGDFFKCGDVEDLARVLYDKIKEFPQRREYDLREYSLDAVVLSTGELIKGLL